LYHDAAATNESSTSSPTLAVGERCHATCRDLAGLRGTVESSQPTGRLTIRLDGPLVAGVLLEIDADVMERIV